MKISYDHLGIFTSVLCAIHCTVLPLLVSSLPFLGIDIMESAAVEWGMIALAFVFGYFSLNHGYRRHHHRVLPSLLFCSGFLLLIVNQLTEEAYLMFCIPAAAVLIITAHVTNIVFTRRTTAKLKVT
ncbi:MerC domain-containing protein [Pseudoflavitalea rhizosphaerae]|uniref:MerC domain-containing protein n=1 Tax=Pseudoflavitalea rhizosphaerae TaxID=1884793 RepID=UPI000F8E5675|nr:MerC domain-containing protein [Pseudoflavitalea rhizosphaerae]